MAGLFTGFKSEESEPFTERPKISVKEIVDQPFILESIRIKTGMQTKFGSADTAIIDIKLNDEEYVCFVNNRIVFDKLSFLKHSDLEYSGAILKITKKVSKNGNPYYDIEEC